MGLERFEWKQVDTKNPQEVIDDWGRWGWKVHTIRNRERVVRSRHSGTSVNSSTGSGSLGSYSGSTTLEREYWTELILVRDPRDPHYRELVELEKIWHSPEPGHRVVRRPQAKTTRIGRFLLWTFVLILPMGIVHAMLKGWDVYADLLSRGGFWYQSAIFLASCALLALPFAIFHKPRPAFAGDPPLTEEEKRSWNRAGAEWNKKRYAALYRAKELTGTR